jgi:pimeloyl-ACP methyl ester carboxylesterase
MKLFSRRRPPSVGTTLAGSAIALGALAVANHLMARRTERRHPPEGSFMEVDGVRLHYSDRGEGSPIVLIHGNMVTGNDYDTSGLTEILQERHRVIIFDRPGFGHSERPGGHLWTADKQADLLHKALQQLGVVRPVVVGHSWGAIVAMAMAVRHEADTAGVVALSGYYFWTVRPDVLLAGVGALPIVGDLLRYTVSPLLNWLLMPLVKRALFSPGVVPGRFNAAFSTAMAVRPSQIRATSQDGALMIPGALALQDHYKDLTLPVVIMAGEGDKVVFKRRAEQLSAAVKRSVLTIVPGAGHMVHYQATVQVAEAVEAVVELSSRRDASETAQRPVVLPEHETA